MFEKNSAFGRTPNPKPNYIETRYIFDFDTELYGFKNEPFFPSFVDTIGIIRTPINFYINKYIIGAKKLIMTRSLYLYSNSL